MSQRRFAVYGFTASGAEAASAWHFARAGRLLEAHDGRIAVWYFDAGLPRSTRWTDLPQAARLLAALAGMASPTLTTWAPAL